MEMELISPVIKDVRYNHVRSVWQNGDLTSFAKIFEILPKSIVANDLGIHYNSFIRRLKNPRMFELGRLMILASLIGIPIGDLVGLALGDIPERDLTKSAK